MRWSVQIAKVKSTVIRIHLTFLLFLFWIGISYYALGGTAAAIGGIIFILLLFLCVTLHEFGHILTARRYGIATPDVTLLPIGGVSRMERFPDEPKHEIAIALAGPAVNFVIFGLLAAAIGRIPRPEALQAESLIQGEIIAPLALVNLFIGLFNLIPAFPMDGGRVLRAALAPRMGRARATRTAAKLGQMLAILFGFAGLAVGNIILIFIALFIYVAAASESTLARIGEATQGLCASDVMISEFEPLSPQASLSDAADALGRTTQSEFPVLDESGRLAGFLTKDGLVKALREKGPDEPVRNAMEADLPTVGRNHEVEELLRTLRKGRSAIGVTDRDGRLQGYVTIQNLLEQLLVADALKAAR